MREFGGKNIMYYNKEFEKFSLFDKRIKTTSLNNTQYHKSKKAKDMTEEEFNSTIDNLEKQIENMKRLIESLKN